MIGHEPTETEPMLENIGNCNNILGAPLFAILAGLFSLWPFLLIGIMIIGPIWAVWYARKLAKEKERIDPQ